MIPVNSSEPKRIGRCIYIGGIYTEEEVLRNRAVSTAGDRWQRGFLRGMAGQCEDLFLLAHRQERVFPFGSVCPRRAGFDWAEEKTFPVSYFNLPVIRTVSLKYGYARALDRALRTSDRRSVIVCYNANMWTSHLAKRARELYGIPTICLHLDSPDMHGDWSEFSRLSGEFAGNVFGSYGAFIRSPVRNKFHLDGGFTCKAVRNSQPVKHGAIAYAGNIAVGKGVEKLISCFKELPGDQLRLVLFGKVDGRDGGSEILRACTSDRRIEYRGVVTYEELEKTLASSAVLVNPVDVTMRGNPLNFPSKMHHYLEMGPPIVSALVDGIAPEYRDLMYCVEKDEDQSEWARRILEAAGEAPEVRRKRIEKVEAFMGEHLWEKQLERLVDWVETWRRPAFSAK
jgi:glycosyltransferase involved in cell wall biosynthesis